MSRNVFIVWFFAAPIILPLLGWVAVKLHERSKP